MPKVAKSLLVFTLLAAFVVLATQRPVPEDSAFIGSKRCKNCHAEEHEGWSDSLHPKMMRLVSQLDTVVADFSGSDSNNLSFHRDEAMWAIGSKWEQQFMGHDGQTETLLPGAWLVEKNQWKMTGWDGWRVPVPVQRCHGCHTVGLNVETGEFTEPGIGCESCHGAAEWHTRTYGYGKITSLVDAQICGQCHSRGRSIDGKYFFPLGYRPGERLDDYFKEERPSIDQNTSHWWGNGRERKRHQEYYAWRQGGHVNSLKTLKENYDERYGPVVSDCLRCHAGEAAVSDNDQDFDIDSVEFGITCSVCHNVHGRLEKVRMECSECHGSGAFFHRQEKNENHVVCGDNAQVNCINCHMPLTVKNGGGFTLRSHSPGIVPPKDTEKYGIPSSCGNGACHSNRSTNWLQEAYQQHYSHNKSPLGASQPRRADARAGSLPIDIRNFGNPSSSK